MNSDARWELVLFLIAAVFVTFGFVIGPVSDDGYRLTARDAAHLRIMTWNVGGATGKTGSPLRDDAIKHVVATIRAVDPDVVCLQEIRDVRQWRQLHDALGRNDWRVTVSPFRSRRVVLCWRRGRGTTFGHGRLGRGAGLSYQTDAGKRVFVVGLHADAYQSSRRNRHIGRAVEELNRRGAGFARILLGDLNLDLDIDKKRGLFTDDEQRDVESYNVVARELVDVGLGRGNTADPDRRLDYIFASDDFNVVQAGPLAGRRRGDMDHDPVVADLAWR